MNGKQSKRLRTKALELCEDVVDSYNDNEKQPVYAPIMDTSTTMVMSYEKVAGGVPRTLKDGCFRKEYKQLKRGYKIMSNLIPTGNGFIGGGSSN